MDAPNRLKEQITEAVHALPEGDLSDVATFLAFLRDRRTRSDAEPPEDLKKVFEESSVEIFKEMSLVLHQHNLVDYYVNGVMVSRQQTINCPALIIDCCGKWGDACICWSIRCATSG